MNGPTIYEGPGVIKNRSTHTYTSYTPTCTNTHTRGNPRSHLFYSDHYIGLDFFEKRL